MDTQDPYPSLTSWMAGANPAHPLLPLIEADRESEHPYSYARSILGPFNEIIALLESARPLRLETECSDFRSAATQDELLITRAELVTAAKLARHHVGFDFGKRGKNPEPDLLLRGVDLAIEVKARRLNGLEDLVEELKAALAENDAVTVYVGCGERPLCIKPARRAELLAQAMECVSAGGGGFVADLDQPWAASPRLQLSIRVFPQPPVPGGSKVVVEGGWELGGHLKDAAAAVLAVLEDPQKVRQAESRPTILLVDAARTGLAWIRPPRIWARMLADALPQETAFIGCAVMIPSLDSADVPISLALRASADPVHLQAAAQFAGDLGLGPMP